MKLIKPTIWHNMDNEDSQIVAAAMNRYREAELALCNLHRALRIMDNHYDRKYRNKV